MSSTSVTARPARAVPAPPFGAIGLLQAKRDGRELSAREIEWLVSAYVSGEVAQEQASAWLMATYLRGMSRAEMSALTGAMATSGPLLDLSSLSRPTVDKHSTGGVGDKISLVLTPLLAALGAAVPQVSGRGLGHTGGTLDKLESIDGWSSELSAAQLVAQLEDIGCAICAAGPDLAPADAKLYRLRDATGTVESVPLIATSIMSKKLAEGTSALVLDVKVGSGAFMGTMEAAQELAAAMLGIGQDYGLATAAVISSMDAPLGRAVGNAIEVAEAVEVLSGAGPDDVIELTVHLAELMLALTGLTGDPRKALTDGSAKAAWDAMVRAQGGDPDRPLPTARHVYQLPAPKDGYLVALDARRVGEASWLLGAGRPHQGAAIDHAAGVLCLAKPGQEVTKDQPLLEVHTNNPSAAEAAMGRLSSAVEVGPEPAQHQRPLVLQTIGQPQGRAQVSSKSRARPLGPQRTLAQSTSRDRGRQWR